MENTVDCETHETEVHKNNFPLGSSGGRTIRVRPNFNQSKMGLMNFIHYDIML